MLKILQARLQQYMKHELPGIQAGFRKGRGTRDQIANICWIIKKAREFQKNIYFCFIDYTKAFDCVDHNKLENSSGSSGAKVRRGRERKRSLPWPSPSPREGPPAPRRHLAPEMLDIPLSLDANDKSRDVYPRFRGNKRRAGPGKPTEVESCIWVLTATNSPPDPGPRVRPLYSEGLHQLEGLQYGCPQNSH